jgi:hypothetical protein
MDQAMKDFGDAGTLFWAVSKAVRMRTDTFSCYKIESNILARVLVYLQV